MQTLTIKVDESYIEQVLNFLQQIPDNKKEILKHTSSTTTKKEDDFLTILANGPTISDSDAHKWQEDIKQGYKSWDIKEF